MKQFVFSLDKMRGYREQVLDKEKQTLSRLRAKEQEIEEQKTKIEEYRIELNEEFKKKQETGLMAAELATYGFMFDNTLKQITELQKALIRATEAVEIQRNVVVSASQGVSVLDKLEERQREEYMYKLNKEVENDISELVNTSIGRKMGKKD